MHHLEGLHLATNLLTLKTTTVSVLIFLKFGWPSVVKCAGVVEVQQSKNSNALFYMSNGMLLLYIIESQNVVGLLMRCSFTLPTRLGCSHAHTKDIFSTENVVTHFQAYLGGLWATRLPCSIVIPPFT